MNKRPRMDGESSRPGAINVQDAKFTRCNVKKRRRISKRRYVDTLVKAGTNPYILRANGVNEYASTAGGYFILANANNTAAAGGDSGHYLPSCWFDVTAAINWTRNPTGNNQLSFSQCGYRPYIRTTTGAAEVTFRKNVQQFQNNVGANTGGTSYQLVYTGQTFSSTQNGFLKAAFHNWMSAKILCYGIYNVPVRYRVSLMRFKRDYLCPGFEDVGQTATSSILADTATPMSELVALQQYLHGPFRYSPLNDQQQNMKKYFQEKVLKDFVIGGVPAPSTGAVAPYMHQLNIFEQFNKIRRYDWQDVFGALTDPQYNAERYDPQSNINQPNVKFTSRWYLVIRAQSLAKDIADPAIPVADSTKWPSFDIIIKQKYSDII